MKIPILNIYYLLCYAWDRLEEGETISVSQVGKNEVSQLFATVLIEGISHLFKKGLDRGYVQHSEEIQRIRGKIDFPMNIKRNFFKQPRLYCEFDELDYNILHNQILKTTVKNMIGCQGLESDTNNKLKNLYFRMHKIEDICLTKKMFRQVQLNRNNFFYDFLIKVCELVYDNLLISKQGEGGKFKDFIQDEVLMRSIFEGFVRNFYKRHLTEYNYVGIRHINWKLEPLTEEVESILPRMITDINIEFPDRKIIIDTKYYQETLTGRGKIKSENLYQLYAYLKNQEDINDSHTLECEGILLYPTIETDYKHEYMHEQHKISIRTINLNQKWKNIEKDLLGIVEKRKAQKSDWKTEPMPKQQITVSYHHEFFRTDYQKLQYGFIPKQMEDKWFIYFEDNKLFCHRSWTGFCIYIIEFQGSSITKVSINRDREQYSEADNDWDCRFLVYLINLLLLHKPTPYPEKEDIDPEISAVQQWSQVGRAMFDEEDDNEQS